MTVDRRRFLQATGTAFAALAASGCMRAGFPSAGAAAGYGPLLADPQGLLDLPAGFSYRVISQLGDPMADGGTVPDAADGMGCFDLGGGKIALVRNHELSPGQDGGGELAIGYRRDENGAMMPGGTTTIVLDAATFEVERQFRSLAGTMRNCAGGTTPWGSWLTCEEPGSRMQRIPDHGYVFEVPASAELAVNPEPLKALGRFNHEAACVDPASGIVYMTEDQSEGLFYRFIPDIPGKLAEGGKLQALALPGMPDSRNWGHPAASVGSWHEARWIDLDGVEALDDDLRIRGAAGGATVFARGEGLWMGDGEMYFCCTSGGAAKLGQIFRLRPASAGPDRLQLFFESTSTDQLNFGDNLTVSPHGHLVVCEDQYTKEVSNHLRWITPAGEAWPLAPTGSTANLPGRASLPMVRYCSSMSTPRPGPWRSPARG
jgi:secreted PhoX family phosphatase